MIDIEILTTCMVTPAWDGPAALVEPGAVVRVDEAVARALIHLGRARALVAAVEETHLGEGGGAAAATQPADEQTQPAAAPGKRPAA